MEKNSNPKSVLILTSLLLAIILGFGFSFLHEEESASSGMYVSVANSGDGFVAITSNGRIDWISGVGAINHSKKINENPACISFYNQHLLVAGNSGSIFYFDTEEDYRKIYCETGQPIHSLSVFKDKIIAGCDGGKLFVGSIEDPFKPVDIELKGNVMSLSTGSSKCYGVTDQGEIFHTNDLVHWEIFDFNKTYKGYYKSCSFSKILCTPDQIAVTGENNDGLPVLFFSSRGNVWTERPLTYTDDFGHQTYLKNVPRDIYCDPNGNQHILVCDRGIMMTIPSCSYCNKLIEVADTDLTGISGSDQEIIIVGGDNFIQIMNSKSI
jgi:hypothetical protein